MENPVYDKVTRGFGTVVLLAFFVPLVATVSALRSFSHKASDELSVVMVFLVIFSAGLLLLIHVTTNVWIRLDPTQRRVSLIYKLFRYSVYRKEYDLSLFDHISLHRAFRGGYRATLVGREQEVILSASWKLGRVRQAAETVAAAIGMKMSDQL